MKPKNQKPKYSLAQNVVWMVKLAWKVRKRVLLFCVLAALVEVLYNLAQLYIAPEILRLVEQRAPMGELLLTILFFTAALFLTLGVKGYFEACVDYPRIDVRSAIIGMVAKKANTTSFPNTLDADFIRLREKAHNNCYNNHCATGHIWENLSNLLMNVGGFLVYLTILSNLDFMLLLVVIATCLAGFLVSTYTNNWMYRHREEEMVYYAKKGYIRGKSQSTILAKDIRIFGLQNWLNDLLDQVHDIHLDFSLKAEKKQLIADMTEAVLTMARNGIAYVYLIHMTLNEGLRVSEFLLYFTAVSTFTTWVMGILRDVSRLHKDSLDISTVREYLEYPEPFKFEDGEPVPKAASYELKLDHVSFRYPGAEQDTIHDLNLVVRPGEKLAIVGLNGAGKTTLVKLLCGLFDPTEGRVLLNGKDVRDFDRSAYYDLFSAVFQEFSIMDVTIAENVAQTTENIDYERIRDCIEKAGLTKSIDELPKGLDTHVGRNVFLDGVLFSGGQTQRLMLARALYKDGPILILDEPTAALDPIAENDIYMKYNDMTFGKTSVFISHRLASTRFCDRIIFVDDGNIAEEGTHESLLELGGEYAKLFEVQSRYYQEGRKFSHILTVHKRGLQELHKVSPKLFPLITFFAIVSALIPYVTVFFSAQILKELAQLRRADVLWKWVIASVFSMGAMAILSAFLKRRCETLYNDLWGRKEILFCRKAFSLDYADVDKQENLDLRNQIVQNENWAGWGLCKVPDFYEQVVRSVIGILSGIALTASLFSSPVPESAGWLTVLNHPLFVLVFGAVMIGISWLAGKLYAKSADYWSGVSEEATFGNRLYSFFGFIGVQKERAADMRIYNQQKLVDAYWGGSGEDHCGNRDVFGAEGVVGKLAQGPLGVYAGLSVCVSTLITGFVYVFTCLKAWGGAFDVGSITQYVGAATALSANVYAILQAFGVMKSNAAYLEKTYEYLDIPNTMYQGSLTTEKRSDRQYEVEFRDVSFKYPGSDLWALRHVNMKFKVGRRLAIVGENGSGKTTFIKLLCRLYDPQEGQILLNGIDIRKYRYDDYINIFSVVFQDFQLISQPLGCNVAGSMNYDEARARKALIDAGFGDRLDTLPDGLNTQLYKDFTEDGVDVSGGEAQKIAIARALYKDAPFIILDEPTAALDPIAESEIYAKFNDISGDKTAIYITTGCPAASSAMRSQSSTRVR